MPVRSSMTICFPAISSSEKDCFTPKYGSTSAITAPTVGAAMTPPEM